MALLTPPQVSQYVGAVPNSVTYWNAGAGALSVTIIPAIATELVGGAAGQIFCSYLHMRAANACIVTFSDTGANTQLVVNLGAGVEKEMAPGEGAPLFGCEPGTGLNIVTSAAPGNFELTMITRAINGGLS